MSTAGKFNLILLFVFLCAVQAVAAKPPEIKLEPFRKKLDKEIRVQFLETPFDRAIEYLERESGVSLIIDKRYVNTYRLRTAISLEKEKISVENALDWLCRFADLDYDVRDEAIMITTAFQAIKPYLVTEIYDVRSFSLEPVDLPGPNIELVSGEADIAISAFADTDMVGTDAAGYAKIIPSTITEGHWHIRGVDVGASGGFLVVTETPAIQKKVQELLESYQKNYGRMVGFDSRYFLMKTELFEKMMGDSDSLVFEPEKAEEFLNKAVNDVNIQQLGTARTACFNTQRVHVLSGVTHSYIRDITPVVAELAGGIDPEIDAWMDGIVFDVRPTISFDAEWVTLEMRGTISSGDNRQKRIFPVPGSNYTGPQPATIEYTTVEKDGEKEEVSTHERIDPRQADGKGINLVSVPRQAVETMQPKVETVKVRTHVRVPDKGAVLFSGGGKLLENLKCEGAEIIMFTRVKVIR